MPKKILITEDEAIIADDIRSSLISMGHEVTGIAISAAECLDQIEKHWPDLVLMDVNLRGPMKGTEAADVIRQRYKLPVVFLTAHSDPATLRKAGVALPYGYLVKPFTTETLRATVETAFYRHEADEKLNKMERWLATTLTSIGDCVVSVDTERRISFFNPAAERLTGWSRQEALGRDYREVVRFAVDATGQPASDPVREAFDQKVVIELASGCSIVTKDGTLVPVDDSAAPTRDDAGAITGVVLVVRDRTAQKQAEEKQRLVEEKLREAQKMESLGVLAAGVAHDFNNLLTGILGNAQLISFEVPAESSAGDALRQLEAAALSAADLCRQMLAYAGKGKYLSQAIDLSQLVDDTGQLLKFSVSKRADVRYQLGRNLPSIVGDTSQIRQVLMNLVLNASEALDQEPGVITIRTGVATAPGELFSPAIVVPDVMADEYVYFEVADNGCGMVPETVAKIFEPFFTTKFAGRGLGLSAVHGIVRAHQGALCLSSKVGVGTTFRVLFPRAERQPEHVPAKPADVSQPWKPCGRILVVDDEEAVRVVLTAILRRFGFEAEAVSGGIDAVQKLAAHHHGFSLVFLDVTMPKMGGIETLAAIKQRDANLPVVLMSGFMPDHFDETKGTQVFDAFLQKPFSLETVRTTTRRILG